MRSGPRGASRVGRAGDCDARRWGAARALGLQLAASRVAEDMARRSGDPLPLQGEPSLPFPPRRKPGTGRDGAGRGAAQGFGWGQTFPGSVGFRFTITNYRSVPGKKSGKFKKLETGPPSEATCERAAAGDAVMWRLR